MDEIEIRPISIRENPTASPQTEEYRTLAVVARTCTALYRPAIQKLWWYQENLTNLIKLLPQASWSIERGQLVRGVNVVRYPD